MSQTLDPFTSLDNKENMEDDTAQPKSRKLRSKSLGVGELQKQQKQAAVKGTRRASMMFGGEVKEAPRSILQPAIPVSPLQQILPGHSSRNASLPQVKAPAIMVPLKTEQEQQAAREQREAERTVALTHREKRRKSLGNRRVSFNPEVTMHMIDVAKTPSTGTRTAAQTPAGGVSAQVAAAVTPTPAPASVVEERAMTPPEQIETEVPSPEPARAEHKSGNRRQSAMTPPLDFNNPDDFSSSPTPSSAFSSPGVIDDAESVLAPDNSSDEEDDAMSMASPTITARTAASSDNESDGEDMDIADDNEITGAFKPWIVKTHDHPRLNHPETDFTSAPARPQDSNPDMPWSGVTHDHPRLSHPETGFNSAPVKPAIMRQDSEVSDGDATMDITRVIGKGVLASPTPMQRSDASDSGEMTMDFTQAIGGVLAAGNAQSSWHDLRPVSTSDIFRENKDEDDDEMDMDITRVIGPGLLDSKTARPAPHNNDSNPFFKAFNKQSSPEFQEDDQTMDITRVVGGIKDWNQEVALEDEEMTMEFTKVIGGVLGTHNIQNQVDEDTVQSTSTDMDMDMTVALGGIFSAPSLVDAAAVTDSSKDDENLYAKPLAALAAAEASNAQADKVASAFLSTSRDVEMDNSATTGAVEIPRTLEISAQPETNEAEHVVVSVTATETGSPTMTRSTRRTPTPKSPRPQRTAATSTLVSTPTKSPRVPNATTPKTRTPSRAVPNSTPQATPVESTSQKRQTPQRATRAQAAVTPTSKIIEAKEVDQSLPGFGHGLSAKRRVAGIASNTATPQKQTTAIYNKSPTPRRASGVGISKPGLGSPAIKAVLRSRKSLGEDVTSAESFSPGGKTFKEIMKDIHDDHKNAKKFEEEESEPVLHGTADLRVMIRMMTPRKEPVTVMAPPSKEPTASKRLFGDIIENINTLDVAAKPSDSTSPAKKKRKSLDDDVFAKNAPAASFAPSHAGRATRASRKSVDQSQTVHDKQPAVRFAEELKENTQSMSAPAVIVDDLNDESIEEDEEISEVLPNISMREFLSMTSISFLDDLNTKHRRETGAWTAQGAGLGRQLPEDEEVSLSDRNTAAFVTAPNLELYTHSCRELKKFISEGKRMAKQIEKKAQEENPPLFREYRISPPDVKAVMDSQFQDIKSYARLHARQIWYGWRKQLMETLKEGASRNLEPLQLDDELINERKDLIDKSLPSLVEKHDHLNERVQVFRTRKAEIDACDPDELESTRVQLEATLRKIEEKKAEVLRAEQAVVDMDEKLRLREETKAKLKNEIEDAEKVKEANKGFSSDEIVALKENVERLEKKYNWSIKSITAGNTLTMTYKSEIQVSFSADHLNESIDLATTVPIQSAQYKHFFDTLTHNVRSTKFQSPQQLLKYIQTRWDASIVILENIRKLELHYPLTIISENETMVVRAVLLVRQRRAKIKVDFVVGETVTIKCETVYGDQMKGWKLDEYLTQLIGEGLSWREGVGEMAKSLGDVGKR